MYFLIIQRTVEAFWKWYSIKVHSTTLLPLQGNKTCFGLDIWFRTLDSVVSSIFYN